MGKKLKEFDGSNGCATAYIFRAGSDMSYPDLEVEVEIGSDGKTKKIWVANGCWSGTLYESKLEPGIVDIRVDWYPKNVIRGCRIVYYPLGITHHQKMFLVKHFPRMTFEASLKAADKFSKEWCRKHRGIDDDAIF